MAETLTELVAKIKTDATELEKGLTDAEKQTEASSKKMSDSLKKVGMAMAASGAAITAALGMMGKAAIDEDINIKRLAISLKNVGVNYDDVKDSLEGVIAATQRKTGIADNEQRDALNELITVTGDYDTALKWLPASLDMAAAKQMDTTSAARLLGRAAIGSTEMLTRYGIIIKEGATAAEILTEVQKKFSGAAEATANPLKVLSAAMGDVAETIGASLIPLIKDVTNKIVDIAIKIQDWAKEHPVLARTLTLVALGVGAVLTVVGGLILAMPVITSMVAAFGVVLHAALGPIGLISIAIAGLVAGGILLWKNWDKVTDFFKKAWQEIKIFFLTGIESILDGLVKFAGWIPGIGDKIEQLRDKIKGMLEVEKIKRDIDTIKKANEELTQKITEELNKQTAAIQAHYDLQRAESKKAYDAAVDAINKEYGIGEATKEVSETRIEAAKRATAELKESYEQEQDAAKETADAKIEAAKQTAAELKEYYSQERDAAKEITDAKIEAARETASELKEYYRQELDAAKEITETKIEAARQTASELKEYYEWEKDVVKEVADAKIEAARQTASELKEQYDKEEDAAKGRYAFELQQVKELYSERLKALNVETDANVKALQRRIDAIDRQTEKEELALQRIEESKKLASLTGEERAEFAAEVARRELRRTRNEEKNALRDQIAETKDRTSRIKEQLQVEEATALASLKTQYDAEIENYKKLNELADDNLKAELIRIEDNKKANEKYYDGLTKLADDNLKTNLARIKDEEKATVKAYDELIKLADTNLKTKLTRIEDEEKANVKLYDEWAKLADKNLNANLARLEEEEKANVKFYDELTKRADENLKAELVRIEDNRLAAITAQQDILDKTLADILTTEKADIDFLAEQLERANTQVKGINATYDALQKRYDIEIVTHQITVPSAGGIPSNYQQILGSYQTGGIVPGPIGMPQLAVVHGGETVTPANESGGSIIINFTQPVFFDREDTMNKFVDMIRKGIQRQDRLRFGGAYNG